MSGYEEHGYVKLGRIVSKNYSQQLTKRVLDLMMGKKKYQGMFFILKAFFNKNIFHLFQF